MSRVLLRNALLLDPEAACATPGSLLVEGARIRAQLRAGDPEPEDAEHIDLRGRKLAPGFIDLHFHGSLIFIDGPGYEAALRRDSLLLVRHGTTGFLATTIAWPAAVLTQNVTRLAATAAQARLPGARPLGIHLEGPWISAEAPGAQPADAVRPFDLQEGREVLDRGEGLIRIVTLAPELPGAAGLLSELERRGIVAALGHTAADASCVRQGIARGVRHVTHLFNAMGGIHHRNPGVAGVALSDDRLSCDLICDGVHVDPMLVRVASRAKGGRLMLITDRVEPPHVDASFGSGELRDDGAALRLPDGRLAGSRLTLGQAILNFRDFAGISLLDAIASCTLRPARLLGFESQRGTLRPGAFADLVLLDGSDRVCETWIEGRRVWPSSQGDDLTRLAE